MKFTEKLKQKNINPIGGDPVTIAFLGDSVTQGCFELYKNSEKSFQTEFRFNEGYHMKLRHMLELCYPAAPINMIHAGISGDTVFSGLERVERDVIAFRPDLTVVCFGLNDSSLGVDKIDDYSDSLRDVLKKLIESGSEVIFLTPNLIADKVSWEIADEFREDFEGMVSHFEDFLLYMETARKVCKELSVTVCDCSRKWQKLNENGVDIVRLLSNRINHPTEEMHWMFANSLFEIIMGI